MMIVSGLFGKNENVEELAKIVKRTSIFMAILSTLAMIVWLVKRTMIKNFLATFLSLSIPILTLVMAAFCFISANNKSFRFALVAMCLSFMLLALNILNLGLAIAHHAGHFVIALDCIVVLLRIGLAVVLYKFLMMLYRSTSLSFSSSSPSNSFYNLPPSNYPPSSNVPSFVLTSSS